MRLIDADAFEVFFSSVPEDVHPESYVRGMQSVLEAIDASPTVQTSAQPEIIRCKDCKWGDWYTAIDGNRYCYCMETGNGGRTEDDYCSYAERIPDDLQ